jgi:transcription initiation factor IIE alpha subunit
MFKFLQKILSVSKTESEDGDETSRMAVCPVCSYKYIKEGAIQNSGKCPRCGSQIESAIPTIFT